MNAYSDLREKLIDDYAKLSPQMQKAARYILDHPSDVALQSMRSLARTAGVQPSTITRLNATIGMGTWQEFQRHYQNRLLDMPASYASRARESQDGDTGDQRDVHLLENIARAEQDNVRAAFCPEMATAMIKACGLIEKAGRVFIVGRGGAYPAAYQFAYAYRLFQDNGVLVDGRTGTFGDELRGINDGDVMIAVGAYPYIRDTVRAVDYASQHKCPIIAVTDSDVAPLAQVATIKLIVSDRSQSFFQSFTAAVSILQALVALLVARGGEDTLQRIAVAEEQLASFETYVEAPSPARNIPTRETPK
ncbi:MurR/RpiR family transcriptional regulator [Thalassospira sp. MA62]|nr:MurR/RpiR family transcriptional regulator [Thalassospira sp. MA62]